MDANDSTIYDTVRSPAQFAFSEETEVADELLELSYDVLNRWNLEKNGKKNVGRVLPEDYLYFESYNGHNHFRNSYSEKQVTWDYSLDSPYDT